MPSTKRTPIEYTSQFGAGIFRPKELVDTEVSALQRQDTPIPNGTLTEQARPSAVQEDADQTTHDSTIISSPDSMQASMIAVYPDSTIQRIRKAVKSPGKEVSFLRMTQEEKNQLTDIVYAYKRRGVKTSENEINRIAVNFLLLDYQDYGKDSLLAKVIAALLA